MRRTQLIAILLVALMAVSVIPAAAVAVREAKPAPVVQQTYTVGATLHPTIQVGNRPQNPLRGQGYVVFGNLYYGSVGLQNKWLDIYWKYPSETSYHYWTDIYTMVSGYFYFTDREAGQRAVNYKIVFNGDSVYYPTTTYKTVYNGKTTTSISSSVSNPVPNQIFSIRGYAKNATGTGLVNAPVKIYSRYWTGTAWTAWGLRATVNTGTGGYYSKSISSAKLCQYYTVYQGYPYSAVNYWSSTSPIISVDSR